MYFFAMVLTVNVLGFYTAQKKPKAFLMALGFLASNAL
jgi:hypothetical protein